MIDLLLCNKIECLRQCYAYIQETPIKLATSKHGGHAVLNPRLIQRWRQLAQAIPNALFALIG